MTFQKDGSWRFIVDLCDARWFDRVNTTQHVTVWIKRNGCKKPMELDISVTAPFLLTTHVRTTTEFTEGGEETSSVTSFVPFGVLATLSDVVDDSLHVTSVKLETAQGLRRETLKETRGLRWLFEGVVDDAFDGRMTVAIAFSLANGPSVTLRQAMAPLTVVASPVTLSVTLSVMQEKGWKKGGPSDVCVQVTNRSPSTQQVVIQLRKSPTQWVIAGTMEESRIVGASETSDA